MSTHVISVDATQRAFEAKWADAEGYLRVKNTGKFLGALAFQAVDYAPLDTTLQALVLCLDQSFNDPKSKKENYIFDNGSEILPPGKVLLQPRGSYASRSALRGHVDLDLDLVFPENFKILFKGEKAQDKNIERTISQVLAFADPPSDGHDSAGNLVIDKDGLHVVLLYVWGKLVGENQVLPHQFLEKPLKFPPHFSIHTRPNLKPTMEIAQGKTLATLTRSISAKITGNPKYPNPTGLEVDFFIKVATKRFGGEEVLVGVDKDGPLGVRQYQTTTFIPGGKEWIGSNPLSPINLTALLALKWWKNSFAEDKTIGKFTVRDPESGDPESPGGTRDGRPSDIKIKSHHFLAAINALNQVPPTDPLYVPAYSSLPFSLVRVMDVMIKVLTFLQRAYQPAARFTIVYTNTWDPDIPSKKPIAVFPFPPITCGVFETLYKQVATSIVGYDAIINSKVIPTFSGRLSKALDEINPPSFTPDTYTFEDL